MQVCNHPELFERRDAKSPIRVQPVVCNIPYLVYETNIRQQMFLKINKQLLFTPEFIAEACFSRNRLFNFLQYLGLSVGEIFNILLGDIVARWRNYFDFEKREHLLYYRKLWYPDYYSRPILSIKHEFRLSNPQIESSNILKDLMFARSMKGSRVVYTHQNHLYNSMMETVEHRNIRLKREKITDEDNVDVENDKIASSLFEFPHIKRPSRVFPCEKTEIPSYLFFNMPKVRFSSPTNFRP